MIFGSIRAWPCWRQSVHPVSRKSFADAVQRRAMSFEKQGAIDSAGHFVGFGRMSCPSSRPFRNELPFARPGQAVGLLGGSFDPPHRGHEHISREAMKRFRLDRVWWMVSPGNPLKLTEPAAMERRLAACREFAMHSGVAVTDLESRLGTRFTSATLAELMNLYPGTRFVWLMGSDNLATFHRWERWRWMMGSFPVGVISRPGWGMSARTSPAALRYSFARLRDAEATLLANRRPPAWCFASVPMLDCSSSDIRARGEWNNLE